MRNLTKAKCMFCNQTINTTAAGLEAAMPVYVLLEQDDSGNNDEVHGYVHTVCFERFVKVGTVRGFATGAIS